MKHKFRASFSILNAWASGNWEDAVNMYFKLEQFTTRAMAEGKDFHDGWEKEIIKTKCLPKVFGGKKLKNPIPEIKKCVQVNDWMELVGVLDCLDEPVIYEFKSGVSTSQQYANGKQVGVYAVLATLSGYYVNKAEIHHFNQHNNQTDVSFVWITDKTIQDAYDWIETHASEMHNYLTENGLYDQFLQNKTK